MRYIPLKESEPCEAWLNEAKKLVEELSDAPNLEARHDIIDRNSKVWGELKEWLLSLSHGKCWFSEAKDCFNHWDVEHYRPKKRIRSHEKEVTQGYWWLAFDWQNLRICGNVGNRKKGSYFPLRTGCNRAVPNGDLRQEKPLLLDPADPDDPTLLTFNFLGEAVPREDLTDEWERERVTESVKRYKLDYDPLAQNRMLVWRNCRNELDKYLADLERVHIDPSNDIARQAVKEAARNIRKLIHEKQAFSAVARACLVSSGDQRALGILRTA
jgi:uncharacterized protein (TIGR02646 family)